MIEYVIIAKYQICHRFMKTKFTSNRFYRGKLYLNDTFGNLLVENLIRRIK